MPTEHRKFTTIANVVTFGRNGAGPVISPLTVMAALTPSLNYPRSRITLCDVQGSTSLTVEQATVLRDQLDAAIHAVMQACPQMATPDNVQLPKEMPRG